MFELRLVAKTAMNAVLWGVTPCKSARRLTRFRKTTLQLSSRKLIFIGLCPWYEYINITIGIFKEVNIYRFMSMVY
jgi:hypothetical protein